jgi:23S rRNA (uracil1939-C5)-methyltransferase
MPMNELTISQLGPKGDGVHFGSQGPIFVERTAPGDRLKAIVQRDARGVFRAEGVEVVTASSHRQSAPCPHYESCGNCTLQHLKKGFYRGWKTYLVRDALKKNGLFPQRWLETHFVEGGSRRRATFTATKEGSQVTLGYYRRRSQEVVSIDDCLVSAPALLELRAALKPLLAPLIAPGESLDVFVQLSETGADLVFTGPLGRSGQPDPAALKVVEKILAETAIVRVGWRMDTEQLIRVLSSKGTPTKAFGPLQVALPPAAFLQPTPEGEKALVEGVLAALPREGQFADLFSGCGTFSGPLLERGPVDAYESVALSVNALRKAAGKGAGLRAFQRDLFKNPVRAAEASRYDALVFDPPRAGCEHQAYELGQSKAGTLVGVSCNPATFARDAKHIVDGGYWLQTIQIVDQFPWSHHVELIGVFTKSKSPRATDKRKQRY